MHHLSPILLVQSYVLTPQFNTFRTRQNGRQLPDYILKCIFLNEIYKFRLTFHRSLKQLEQLERLRSENTPRRLMITHTIGSQVKQIIDLELKTLQSRHDFQSQGQMTLKIWVKVKGHYMRHIFSC